MPLTVLRRVAELGMVHGDGFLGLGSRQEIILTGVPVHERDHVRQGVGALLPEHHPRRPNIVTTRMVTGRTHRTPWLSEGAYDHVLETFTTPPAIPVNLVDPRQGYVPLFTGRLHFVATGEAEFWSASFNANARAVPVRLASAIHSDDLAAVTRLIQQACVGEGGPDLPQIQSWLEEQLGNRMRDAGQLDQRHCEDCRPLIDFVLDTESGLYTLGIPAQSRPLPCAFLVDLTVLARQCGLATVHLTPWKSLLLHGISREDRDQVERLLLRHRIGLHPGAWDGVFFDDCRTPPARAAACALRERLNTDLPHPGPLRIAMVEDEYVAPDTAIVVRAHAAVNSPWNRTRFSVYLRASFDRFHPVLAPFAAGLSAKELPDSVLALIERYASGESQPATAGEAVLPPVSAVAAAYRCADCGNEYNPLYGDPLGKIESGRPFEELPDTWRCPTCDAPINAYRRSRGAAA